MSTKNKLGQLHLLHSATMGLCLASAAVFIYFGPARGARDFITGLVALIAAR